MPRSTSQSTITTGSALRAQRMLCAVGTEYENPPRRWCLAIRSVPLTWSPREPARIHSALVARLDQEIVAVVVMYHFRREARVGDDLLSLRPSRARPQRVLMACGARAHPRPAPARGPSVLPAKPPVSSGLRFAHRPFPHDNCFSSKATVGPVGVAFTRKQECFTDLAKAPVPEPMTVNVGSCRAHRCAGLVGHERSISDPRSRVSPERRAARRAPSARVHQLEPVLGLRQGAP